jgi:hypothetical protein
MISSNAVSQVVTQPPKRVGIAHIEPELGMLWAQFNQTISGGHTVMRACMSNLIIYCDTPQEAEIISQEIAPIVDAHPARILLLVGNGKLSEGSIEAHIAIYYTALDDGWQVCAEKGLKVSEMSLGDLKRRAFGQTMRAIVRKVLEYGRDSVSEEQAFALLQI